MEQRQIIYEALLAGPKTIKELLEAGVNAPGLTKRLSELRIRLEARGMTIVNHGGRYELVK